MELINVDSTIFQFVCHFKSVTFESEADYNLDVARTTFQRAASKHENTT